ncbi:hypothetical protein [Clostridium weizhouense]|uniref:Uncharacterized protein n=1 Tax=Clostridium weizhouense TaxID=2859781 RepID=A0ABS7AQ18_9CLOT|nr:hypothetical protein [Clostridium weizhouense]MBW6410762.1 hypothetical protein [Clostridium weizhouense]
MKKRELKQINKTNKDKYKHEFLILRIITLFLEMTPILFLIYLYINSLQTGEMIFKQVIENPSMTIAFITSMLAPFSGICCDYSLKNLENDKNLLLSEIILGLVVLGQIVLFNLIAAFPIIYVMYKVFDKKKIDFNKFKIEIKNKKAIGNLAISVFTMFIVIICTYVRMRL